MIRWGFLSTAVRKELLSLARDGPTAHRANAILLLDDGSSCEQVAKVLYLDDDTVRSWRKLYDERGIAGLEQFDAGGSSSRLSAEQEEALKAYVAQALPRTTRQIEAFIEREFGIVYESRAGLIALLHRLGLEYHKQEVIGRKLDAEKQQAFIEDYETLRNTFGLDEAVLVVDAVHPTRAAPRGRPLPGAERRKSGNRADKRAPAHEYPRRYQRGDRANPHDRGGNHRRRLHEDCWKRCILYWRSSMFI